MDYSIFYTHLVDRNRPITEEPYDVLISGYNKSDRVRTVFDRVRAHRKIWVIHREYCFVSRDLPTNGETYECGSSDESQFWRGLVEALQLGDRNVNLCIDITGIVAPYMMFLIAALARLGMRTFDCLYSEPVSYLRREETVFSSGHIREVRPVAGFTGFVDQDTSGDLLIIGAGYEDRLISEVAQYKDAARKAILLGLPSLRVDMYQQNVLRLSRAEEALGPVPRRRRFYAPASDPFVTASVLQDIVKDGAVMERITNLYICPLASKPQALGSVIFYLYHRGQTDNMSIILPFCTAYETRTDVGLSRTWRYEVELGQTQIGR